MDGRINCETRNRLEVFSAFYEIVSVCCVRVKRENGKRERRHEYIFTATCCEIILCLSVSVSFGNKQQKVKRPSVCVSCILCGSAMQPVTVCSGRSGRSSTRSPDLIDPNCGILRCSPLNVSLSILPDFPIRACSN